MGGGHSQTLLRKHSLERSRPKLIIRLLGAVRCSGHLFRTFHGPPSFLPRRSRAAVGQSRDHEYSIPPTRKLRGMSHPQLIPVV